MNIVGIDEVGRGCWAGPLVAGAVLLREPIDGLKDSKKLSKRRRDQLTTLIQEEALAYGLGWVWPDTIDISGINTSVKIAMERAYMALQQQLQDKSIASREQWNVDEVIIDGNINYLPEVAGARALIRADDTVPAASAASIIAKVARDNYMAQEAHGKYPLYGFERHVGYGTPQHIKALADHGVTPLHRKSYKPIQQIMLHSDS